MSAVDVLIPTYQRPAPLAVTLTGLLSQTLPDFRVVVSDQSEASAFDAPVVASAVRLLRHSGRQVVLHRHLPRRGLAEQRQFLLSASSAPYVLFLDDDVVMEPDLLQRLLDVIRAQRCGFVGSALIGVSFADDVRPHEQAVELWDGPVTPEVVGPDTPAWERWRLHNAANILHVGQRLGATAERPLLYKVAWVGGCVLYDRRALLDCGGFSFWSSLPSDHCGEDVVAQQRVMAAHGGCGVLPSGAYHQEVPTTVHDRSADAPHILSAERAGA